MRRWSEDLCLPPKRIIGFDMKNERSSQEALWLAGNVPVLLPPSHINQRRSVRRGWEEGRDDGFQFRWHIVHVKSLLSLNM